MAGEVIGINTLKLNSTYEGICFSIPINSAVTIFNQLITDGKVSDYDSSFVTGNGAIGITKYIEIGEEEAEYYNYPVGIVILALDVDSNAYSAGLRRYDTIVAFEGKPVKTVAELNKLKSSYKAGDEVTLTVSRDGVGEMDISFKLDLMG
jgi:serine protease Do